MIKRFFTKKSVALIFATVMLVGFLSFDSAKAAVTCTGYPFSENNPAITSTSNSVQQNSINRLVAKQLDLNQKILNIKCKAQAAGVALSPVENKIIEDTLAQIKTIDIQVQAFGQSVQTGALLGIFEKLNNV